MLCSVVFQIIMCSTVEELHCHIEPDQLPGDLGGTQQYDHQEWVQHRAVSNIIGASHPLIWAPMGLPTFFFFCALVNMVLLWSFFCGLLLKNALCRTKHIKKKKNQIGLIFCRSIPMDCLQGQLKMVWEQSFFPIHWVIWGRLPQKCILLSQNQ